jgi:hypothetical protein
MCVGLNQSAQGEAAMKGASAPKRHLLLVVFLVLVLAGMGLAGGPLAQLVRGGRSSPGATTNTTAGPPVRLVAHGFGQDNVRYPQGGRAGYAFLVENPDPEQAIQDSEYRVTAYDSAGSRMATDAGPIVLLMPGQRLGVGGTLFLAEGARVARIGIEIRTGQRALVKKSPALTVDEIHCRTDISTAIASGVVRNPFDRNITDLRVSVVAYDASGRIIGGGFTYLAFVPASGAVGVISSLDAGSEAARVEMYASLSEKSSVTARGEGLPPGASDLRLISHGFGQRGPQIGYALLVQNPNDGLMVTGTHYHVTGYGADGEVLATDDGRVEMLLPGETLGVASVAVSDGNEPISRTEVHILPGKCQLSGAAPSFHVDDATYDDDASTPRVSGRVVNPYGRDATKVRVSAIPYDAEGNIIGGGYAFLDLVAANGEAVADIGLTTAGRPARVELYATRSALSEME